MGKGYSRRPQQVPDAEVQDRWNMALGITCKRCGKTGLHHDGVHSCSPQVKQDEGFCSNNPKAPHGFDRNASHNAGRYVCECEGWEE